MSPREPAPTVAALARTRARYVGTFLRHYVGQLGIAYPHGPGWVQWETPDGDNVILRERDIELVARRLLAGGEGARR